MSESPTEAKTTDRATMVRSFEEHSALAKTYEEVAAASLFAVRLATGQVDRDNLPEGLTAEAVDALAADPDALAEVITRLGPIAAASGTLALSHRTAAHTAAVLLVQE